MSDDAAIERHQRHETQLHEVENRVAIVESDMLKSKLWQTGNGTPHRGAEARITRIEECAMMKTDVKQMIADAISARQRSALAIITALAPYVGLAIMVMIWLRTGKAPAVLP